MSIVNTMFTTIGIACTILGVAWLAFRVYDFINDTSYAVSKNNDKLADYWSRLLTVERNLKYLNTDIEDLKRATKRIQTNLPDKKDQNVEK